MKRIRCYIATIALVATLGGPFVQGVVFGPVANVTSIQHVTSSFVAGKSAKLIAVRPYWPCPVPGVSDC